MSDKIKQLEGVIKIKLISVLQDWAEENGLETSAGTEAEFAAQAYNEIEEYLKN